MFAECVGRGDARRCCVAFVHELKARGYFTADEKEYLASVSRELDAFGVPILETAADIGTALAALGFTVPGGSTGDAGDDLHAWCDLIEVFQRTHPELVVDGVPGPLTHNPIRLDTEKGGERVNNASNKEQRFSVRRPRDPVGNRFRARERSPYLMRQFRHRRRRVGKW